MHSVRGFIRLAVTSISSLSFISATLALSGCMHTRSLLQEARGEHCNATLDNWDIVGAAPAPDGQLDVCLRLSGEDGSAHLATLHIPVRDPSRLSAAGNAEAPFYEYRVQVASLTRGCHLRGAPLGLAYAGAAAKGSNTDPQKVLLYDDNNKVRHFAFSSVQPLFGDTHRIDVPLPYDHDIRIDHRPQYLLYTLMPLSLAWDAGNNALTTAKLLVAYPQVIVMAATVVGCLHGSGSKCWPAPSTGTGSPASSAP